MNWWRKIRNDEGAAAIEAALSAVVGLSLLLGCCNAFLMLYDYHYVSYAARDATRWAIVRGAACSGDSGTMPNCGAAQSDIQTHLQNLNFPGITTSNLTATASWYSANNSGTAAWAFCSSGTPATNCNNPGNLVKVTVSYPFPLSIPFMVKKTVNLSSTSQLVISQ